jgi:hypothetical protein
MPTAARSRTFRMLPPSNRPTFVTQRGQILDGTANGYVDAVVQDADALQHAGWTRISEIGTTASRPMPGPSSDVLGLTVTLAAGYCYYDTTLSLAIYFSPALQAWVHIDGTTA